MEQIKTFFMPWLKKKLKTKQKHKNDRDILQSPASQRNEIEKTKYHHPIYWDLPK